MGGLLEAKFGCAKTSGHFSEHLSDWDVSNVPDMTCMLHGASAFNGDLSAWNVSHVRNVATMLENA